jgi:hypothetical protein
MHLFRTRKALLRVRERKEGKSGAHERQRIRGFESEKVGEAGAMKLTSDLSNVLTL